MMTDFTANLRIIGVDAAYVWKCSKCGKWSHAKKKPTHHLVPSLVDTDYGTQVEGYYHCGPFEEWLAERSYVPNLRDLADWDEKHAKAWKSA